MKKSLLCGVLVLLMPSIGYSQDAKTKDTLNRTEYTAAIGLSQALTDIGGSPQIGTHFLRDFNIGAVRYAGDFGYRRRLGNRWAVKAMLTIGELYGNDALSSNLYRKNRNQNFRSIIIEPSLEVEYYFYHNDKSGGHHYKIKNAHGLRAFDAYLLLGIGGFYFNPQGKYINGQWYDLRPLSTEGEGLPGGPPEYSQFAISFPAGLGVKYLIDQQMSVGMEFSTRLWTSTDYIDDTHGKYFSPEEIQEYKGPIAAYFSHPVLGLIPGQDAVGQERGNPNYNDSYMFLMVTVNYRLKHSRQSINRGAPSMK